MWNMMINHQPSTINQWIWMDLELPFARQSHVFFSITSQAKRLELCVQVIEAIGCGA